MINLTEFDKIKLIAASYGLLSGILSMAVQDVLNWLIKSHKLDLVKLFYKSMPFGLFLAVVFSVWSSVMIASADIPLENINQSIIPLALIVPLSNVINFLWSEFIIFKRPF